jgi:urease accessory protein
MPRDTPSPLRHQRAHGRAELGFVARPGGGTVLRHLYQSAPCRVLFPTPEPGEAPQAALINVAGGLAGGDSLEIAVTLAPGTTASLTTPAAEKLYRSLGEDSRITVELSLAEGATLEWLPQETILFEGSRLRRALRADMAPNARLLAAEMLVFGRAARGETLTRGLLHDRWRLHREGRLVWADALELSGEVSARLNDPFGFGGAGAMASLLLAASPTEATTARQLLRDLAGEAPGAVTMAATLPRPGLLLARWLGAASPLRAAVAQAIPALRSAILGLPPCLPRLWTT